MARNFWIAVILCVSFSAGAQNTVEKIQELETIVITGQYKKTKIEDAVQKIKVINRKQIDAMAAVTLKDVLMNENNIRISQDNVLGSSISLQGISGQNIKILIDGVPVIGRLNGNVDVSQINLNTIERIEIVEGPLSVNYGTDALAGTINLITKQNKKDGLFTSLNSYYENIGQYNLDGSISYNYKKSSYSFSLGRNFFDGWNAHDGAFEFPIARLADSSRFKQWKPKEQYFSRFSYCYQKNSFSLKPYLSYFYEKITNRGMPRAPYNEMAFDDEYNSWRIDGGLSIQKTFDNQSSLNIQAAYNDYKRIKNTFVKDLTTLNRVLSETPGSQDTISFSLLMSRGTWNTNRKGKSLDIQLGYELSLENSAGKRIEGYSQDQQDIALFGSSEWCPVKSLVLKPALRITYNSRYKAPPIPSMNVKLSHKAFVYRASYARGFRAPTLKELYFDFVDINHNIVGNTNLKAEYSNNFTGGIAYKKKFDLMKIDLDLGVFYNDLTNLITLAIAQDDSQQYTYVNIGAFKTFGNQLNTSIQYKKITCNLGVAYIGRFNDVSTTYDVPDFNYSPELRFNCTYNNVKYQYSLSAFYKYNGKRNGFYISEDIVTESVMEDYNLLDANLTKRFMKGKINISIGAKNILNVTDVQSSSNTDGIHASNSGSVSMNWGRSFFTSLKFKI